MSHPQEVEAEPYDGAEAELAKALRDRVKGVGPYTQDLTVVTFRKHRRHLRHLSRRAAEYGLTWACTSENARKDYNGRRGLLHRIIVKGDPVEVIRFKWHFCRLNPPPSRRKD